MKSALPICALALSLSGCVAADSAVHSFNGNTVEMELIGDVFVYGNQAQQQEQIEIARAKASKVCGKPATFLSRRLDEQPQNGMFYVVPRDIALFKCG